MLIGCGSLQLPHVFTNAICLPGQSVWCTTCMQCPTTQGTQLEVITRPSAGTRHWGSGTSTMTPGIVKSSQNSPPAVVLHLCFRAGVINTVFLMPDWHLLMSLPTKKGPCIAPRVLSEVFSVCSMQGQSSLYQSNSEQQCLCALLWTGLPVAQQVSVLSAIEPVKEQRAAQRTGPDSHCEKSFTCGESTATVDCEEHNPVPPCPTRGLWGKMWMFKCRVQAQVMGEFDAMPGKNVFHQTITLKTLICVIRTTVWY